jgi:hypothetical protein
MKKREFRNGASGYSDSTWLLLLSGGKVRKEFDL